MRLAFDRSKTAKKKGGKNEPKKEEPEGKKNIIARIIVSNNYADWQKYVLEVISGSNFNKLTIVDDWKVIIRNNTKGDIMKKSLQFGSWILVFLLFLNILFNISKKIGNFLKI